MALNIIKIEEEILQFFNKNEIAEKWRNQNKYKKFFKFLQGPPYPNAAPHIGHYLTTVIKTTILRHKVREGFDIKYKATWDTHGLNVELALQKQLGLKTNLDIINYGIDKYNSKCEELVFSNVEIWNKTYNKAAFFIDYSNPTIHTATFEYMNMMFKHIQTLYKKGYLYKSFKLMYHSPTLGSVLSNMEAKQNYININESGIIVKFQDKNELDLYYLSYTTTPWTLYGHFCLAANASITYVKVKYNNEKFILSKNLLKSVFGKMKYEILEEFNGRELKDKEYNPIFDKYNNLTEYKYKIVLDDYVSNNEGTALLHCACAYGAEDYQIGLKNNLITKTSDLNELRCYLDDHCNFTDIVPEYKGKFVKDCDIEIINNLKEQNKLFKKISINHSIPHCYRSGVPLITKPAFGWFLDVEKVKERMIEINKEVNWCPETTRKRFDEWIINATDWCISRSRFYGCPLPIYEDEKGEEVYVIGSANELENLAGLEKNSIKNLHRQYIDNIRFKSPKTGNLLKRVPYVADVWLDSSMLTTNYYAENELQGDFQLDYISEGLDQTSCWFYYLLVISTMLYNKGSYKNVGCLGLVLDENRQKLSKTKQNYTDLQELIKKYGAEPLSLYLLSSPAGYGEGLSFKNSELKEIVRSIHIPLNSALSFFEEYKNLYEYKTDSEFRLDSSITFNNEFDIYLINLIDELNNNIQQDLDNYKMMNLVKYLTITIDKINNNYIKLNRYRLKGNLSIIQTYNALNCLGLNLFKLSMVISHIMPFFSEYLYGKLLPIYKTNYNLPESVQLILYKQILKLNIHKSYKQHHMETLKDVFIIIEMIRKMKSENNYTYKYPLKDVKIYKDKIIYYTKDHLELIKKECNILNLSLIKLEEKYELINIEITPNKAKLGKTYRKEADIIIKLLEQIPKDKLLDMYNSGSIELQPNIRLSNEYVDIKCTPIEKENYKSSLNDNTLVYINYELSDEVKERLYIDTMLSSIQNKRKEQELKPWNRVKINILSKVALFNTGFNKFKNYIYDVIGYNEVYLNESIEKNDNLVTYTEDFNNNKYLDNETNENQVRIDMIYTK